MQLNLFSLLESLFSSNETDDIIDVSGEVLESTEWEDRSDVSPPNTSSYTFSGTEATPIGEIAADNLANQNLGRRNRLQQDAAPQPTEEPVQEVLAGDQGPGALEAQERAAALAAMRPNPTYNTDVFTQDPNYVTRSTEDGAVYARQSGQLERPKKKSTKKP